MHVTDFDEDYLLLAEKDNNMLLCLHTMSTISSDVLPPPKTTRASIAALMKKNSARLASRISRAS
eukprot:6199165-Pleurochrysis_carterae.AAC.1